MTSPQFAMLYPDIDPTQALRVSASERLSVTVAVAVISYGCALGDLLITAAGLVLTVFAVVALSAKTPRRIRNEARSRFPAENWAENANRRRVSPALFLAVAWLAIGTLAVAALLWVPTDLATWGAGGVALIAALLTWLLPGLNPVWSRTAEPNASTD